MANIGAKDFELILVEDNLSDAMLVAMALEDNKLMNHIIHLRSGQEALDFIFREGQYERCAPSNNQKVILLDLKMPQVSGIDVLRRIKSNKETRKIPVIAFTISNDGPDVKECYHLGVNSYIVKPMDHEQFKNTINRVGNYWISVNRQMD